MHVREIPHQVLGAMTEDKVVETHNFHSHIRELGRSRSLDLYNYGPTVLTSDMGDGLWLRLSDETAGTNLEVVQSIRPDTGPPIDHPSVHDSHNYAIYKSLGRLYAGESTRYMDEGQVRQTVHMSYSIGDIDYLEHSEAGPRQLGARLVVEMAERAFVLLYAVKGRYDLSTFYKDEITPDMEGLR